MIYILEKGNGFDYMIKGINNQKENTENKL